jgi:hypothetical protein
MVRNLFIKVLFLLLLVFSVLSLSRAQAATVGSWSKVCVAPNWITGIPEPVADMNINDPSQNFWGYTSQQSGGKWLTQYNLARIAGTQNVLIFLFYHECSHAQFKTASETVADCQGLKAMGKDINVTPQIINEIKQAYASVGRPFPSGPCN